MLGSSIWQFSDDFLAAGGVAAGPVDDPNPAAIVGFWPQLSEDIKVTVRKLVEMIAGN